MDHKNFETQMIDFVNQHRQEEAIIRCEALREQQEMAANMRRKKATKAIIESILWVVSVGGIMTVMSFVANTNFVSPIFTIMASSLFTFVAGVRINTLALRISKYGGR